MKKTLVMLLIATSMLSFAACGNTSNDNINEAKEIETVDADYQEEVVAETKQDENIHTEEDTDVNEDSMSDSDNEDSASSEEDIVNETINNESIVVNNGNHFVQYGNTIYFQLVNEVGLEDSGLFGDFHNNSVGPVDLYSYNIFTSETVNICSINNYSKMMITGDKMFLQSMDSDFHNTISVFDINLQAVNDTHEGYILAWDNIGKYVAVLINEEVNYSIDVYDNGEKINNIPIESIVQPIGIVGDSFIYVLNNDESCSLNQINLLSGEIIDLGVLPTNEYSIYGEPDYFSYDDENVYFTYEFYEGTGHFHAASYLVSAGLDVENSIEYRRGNNKDEEATARYTVKDGVMIDLEGVPGTAEIDGTTLCWYDKAGNKIAVKEDYGWSYLENGNVLDTEIVELVGGYIYAVRQELYRAPEDDIGWREAYKILTSDVYKIDPATGSEEKIAYCQMCP